MIEPKAALEGMHLDAFHRTSRREGRLRRFKELGFVKKIKIVPMGDSRDCAAIQRFRKIHNLDEAPELPLPECDAAYCRCDYQPILSRKI